MMYSSKPGHSKADVFEDDELFENSSFLTNFENSSFKEKAGFSESHINDSHNTSELNVSALCCDEELNGYDKLTGKTWIYPTNYPVRDYQFNIIKAALLKNTLVSLPTGLGKTFIAAVIMYNFYRWYPLGKIVFTAPTRPLVAQQIDACYNIIAIPPNDTIEMTGHMQVNTRKAHWQSKRVFFATPQVIYNDIMSGICPSDKIRCLVLDEAHRARGNYAYCQIVGSLTDMGHKLYRILALSATPGSRVEDVANVVKNLHIAHLELRTENCLDVAPYSHARKINTVVIKLGPQLTQLRQQYIEILDGYARRLKQFNILPQNLGNLSKGRVVMMYKEYQTKERSARHPQHNIIMKDFTILIALYHGLELLIKHGSRVFLNFFDEHPEKSWMQADDQLTALLERLRDDLGVNPLSLDRSILPDGTIPEMPKNLCFGHPKFDKLKEIMMEHFIKCQKNGQDTRAIVFCEYRESVNLVHCLLLQCRPIITPMMFVGQGASGKDGKTVVSQKQQLRVMRSFRAGACNALVATCVAEEGLDVGAVDLILCFDVASRSPVRLVQRCGRTGRERGGQVHILVTEGREHQTLLDCMRQRDGLNKKVLQSREVESCLYKSNPRMVPHDFVPVCQKMYITVAKKQDPKEKKDGIEKAKKGQKDLRTMLLGRASSGSSTSSKEVDVGTLISEEEFNEMFPDGFDDRKRLPAPKEYWAMSREKLNGMEYAEDLKLHTWLEWQRSLQKTVNIGHSTDSEILSALLQCSDAKRFNMPPSTQNPVFHTQDIATQNLAISSTPRFVLSPAKTKQTKKKTKALPIKSPGKNYGDIRALFSTATKSTKSYTKLINDLGIQDNEGIPTHLINLLVDLSLDNSSKTENCYICQHLGDCSFISNIRKERKKLPLSLRFLLEPKLPNPDLLDDVDANMLSKYGKNNESLINPNINKSVDMDKNLSGNFDLDFDFCSPEFYPAGNDKTPVKSNNNSSPVLSLNKSKSNFELELEFNSPPPETKPTNNSSGNDNFEIGDIEDIFAESSPEENIQKEIMVVSDERVDQSKVKKQGQDKKDPNSEGEALGFFGLDSIDDIFAEDDSFDKLPEPDINDNKIIETVSKNKKIDVPDYENPRSPSILSGKVIPTSPILGSQINTKLKKLSMKKNMIPTTPISDISKTEFIHSHKSLADRSNNKSMFTITQLVDMINKTDNGNLTLHNSNIKKDNSKVELEKGDERSNSPIILTQADKKKSMNISLTNKSNKNLSNKSESLIILDSDSDSSDDTQIYECDFERSKDSVANSSKKNETVLNPSPAPVTSKRKLDFEDDDFATSSPYFNKKHKPNPGSKSLSLKEKVLAALSSNKVFPLSQKNNDPDVNFMTSPVIKLSQKENQNPFGDFISNKKNTEIDKEKECVSEDKIEMLQMFKRHSKVKSPKNIMDNILKNNVSSQKRKMCFDSEDDFVSDDDRNPRPSNDDVKKKSLINHKVRKKKKPNSFLELEAALSGSEPSSDELSDASAGSLADFLCDDDAASPDIHAHYLRSIKSPVNNGVFKIPLLPQKYNKSDLFSQFVEEDNYEMDSFCVDSHIGLTQANDVSELELAEIVLEEKRRAKRNKSPKTVTDESGDSPIVRRKNKITRQIHSDSDDSS
ncbi:Fanconi anemia group M protein [Amyelois transitella]|uniref:Fanconi anemia group M protein n=1 Tax=Amyelois transitella TaxID=680683 RepID=UPI00298F742F|nr:Fanconi anemia group M protein [Amyelois transitella]